jgi:hypothetical protein
VSTLTIPNVFVNATTIQAAPFNTNFNAVATSVNNIDTTNIGAAGINLSTLVGTTFPTGSYTFPETLAVTGAITGSSTLAVSGALSGVTSLSMNGALSGVTALSMNGALSGVTALGVSGLITGTAVGEFYSNVEVTTSDMFMQIGNTGNTTNFGIESTAGGAIFAGGSGYATVLGTALNRAVQFATNNSVAAQIPVGGGFQVNPLINSVNTMGFVPPVYTAAGAATASTLHTVFVTATLSASAVNAGPFTGLNFYTATVTLSGSAAFTSATSFTAEGGATYLAGFTYWEAIIGLPSVANNVVVAWNSGGTLYIGVDVGSGAASLLVSFYLTGS